VKTRFQLQVGTGGADGYSSIGDCFKKIIKNEGMYKAGKYNGSFDALKKIVQAEGPLALYNGLEATVWRHAMWNGGYFGCIQGVKNAIPEAETPNGNLARNFVAGAIGGTFATILNTPFDVVKTRIQNQPKGSVLKYNWTLPAVGIVYREEGFRALYKGFVPKVLRLGPGGGILLVVFDTVSTLIRKHILIEDV
ncbi:hypothetical protein BGZ46_004568, partial [Entomortierella lignicola]